MTFFDGVLDAESLALAQGKEYVWLSPDLEKSAPLPNLTLWNGKVWRDEGVGDMHEVGVEGLMGMGFKLMPKNAPMPGTRVWFPRESVIPRNRFDTALLERQLVERAQEIREERGTNVNDISTRFAQALVDDEADSQVKKLKKAAQAYEPLRNVDQGTIISFVKQYEDDTAETTAPEFTYAAVKAVDMWYLTGRVLAGTGMNRKSRLSHTELVVFLLTVGRPTLLVRTLMMAHDYVVTTAL